MATGRPEVEVVLSADDEDLSDELDMAETKILGLKTSTLAAGAAIGIALGAIGNAIRHMVGWLETAEDKWEEYSKESRKHLRDFGKELEDTKNQVVLAFGQMWDAAKRPVEAELLKMLPPLEQISVFATTASERVGTLSSETLKAYKRVEPLVKVFSGAAGIAGWLAFPGLPRGAGRGAGFAADIGAMALPTEREQELERQRIAAVRETEERAALAERGRQMQEQLLGMAQGLGQFGTELVQKFSNTADYSMSEFMRNARKGFDENIAEMREDLEKELEKAEDAADRAGKRQVKAWERVRDASKALLDYQNRDTGFQASMQSLTGLYSRIQTAAASRPAEDMTEKRLKERFAQAQKLHDDAKKETEKQNQEVIEAIKNLDRIARWG